MFKSCVTLNSAHVCVFMLNSFRHYFPKISLIWWKELPKCKRDQSKKTPKCKNLNTDFISNSLLVNKVGLAADEGVKTSNGAKRVSDSGPTLESLRTALKRTLSGVDSMTLPLHTLLAHTLCAHGRGVQRSTKSTQQAYTRVKCSLGRVNSNKKFILTSV